MLFLWLYFLSISLGGDTYHTPPPPQPPVTLMDGPRAVAAATPPHFPWTHTNSQQAACQSASKDLGQGACLRPSRVQQTPDPFLFLPCPSPSQFTRECSRTTNMFCQKRCGCHSPGTQQPYLLIAVLRALLQLYYSALPKGGTIVLQFSPFFRARGGRQDKVVTG